MKKISLFIPLIILVVFLTLPVKASAFWPFDSFNKSSSAGTQTKFPDIIQRIIDKFKLNSGEVEKVVEEVKTEKRREMKSRRETKLEEAVKAGVITSEQKQALLNKENEWQQKQAQLMEEKRQWMEQSGIDFEKLAPYEGFGSPGMGGRGFRKGHKFGNW